MPDLLLPNMNGRDDDDDEDGANRLHRIISSIAYIADSVVDEFLCTARIERETSWAHHRFNRSMVTLNLYARVKDHIAHISI